MACPYGFNGTGAIERHADGTVRWTHADPEVHISDEVAGAELLLEKYAVIEPCPAWPQTFHARRRSGDEAAHDDERGDLMETDWRGRNVRIFPGWDVLRRAPFVEGQVVSLRPAMWVVRDAEGVEQEWPVTLPIEEA